MRRVTLLAGVVGAALLAFLLVVIWYLWGYQSGGANFSGMMGQMMGSGSSNGLTPAMPTGVWFLLIALVAVAVIGVVGVGYYAAFPEIRPSLQQPSSPPAEEKARPDVSWAVLIKTSKPEEKKVLEVLAAHDGSYLQKFVVKETGLSRLKTHRIVSRLAERGIITVEASGNTNQLTLPAWLKIEAAKSTVAA